ncbi:STT3 domain-containing protein [Methanobrevibacter sp.]|uniref:STT3 domain-containing protein n=1 Tax=Methanobrevibacter sp. TaxID=66852 RepID=UPI0026DEDA17|nr:STT3 domain-containing protein [Methanobrevibacter sp.]MDO5823643.1 STT3 domain-containing protein [Methanobrevibacter sp.]
MNKETKMTIVKSVLIIFILMAVVFALKMPAADLNIISDDAKDVYVDSSGLPYFSEMDSYYNLRLTEDYIDHGHVGDEIINGSEWDMHRYAPTGNEIDYELGIVYVTSFLHDVANKFFGDYSVKEIAFWAGAIVSTLAVIPAYIFSRRLTDEFGAIVATLLIVLAPNYFAHTFPGFFDTDMFYYIFSLFFIFFFIESIRAKNILYKVLFAVLSILSIGLFSQSWTGYIFYIGLMGIFSIVYLIVSYYLNMGEDDQNDYPSKFQWFIHQNGLKSIVILGVIGFIGLAIFKGVDGVLGLFGSLLNLLSLQSASRVVGGFPNVLVSVAELQIPSMLGSGLNSMFLANTAGAVNGIGGIAVLFAGLTVLYLFVKNMFRLRGFSAESTATTKPPKADRISSAKKLDDSRKLKFDLTKINLESVSDVLYDKKLTVLYGTLFVVWAVLTALAVTKGSRFITTLVLPFALLTGIFIDIAKGYIKNRINDDRILLAIISVAAIFAAVPLATINTIMGIALFVIIIAAGAASIYGLKPKATTGSEVPIKKTIAVIAIVVALATPCVCGAFLTSNTVVPGTSDPMWNSMTWINETQPEDTVITSWWDFGYLFEIAADRQVTFDGGSQSGDRAFWLGKAMTTDNLELSAGIFRMLDTTGSSALDLLMNITGDSGKSTDILIDILPKTAGDAQKTLKTKYHLTGAQAKEVVQYTHPKNPRPVIFVASADMLQKAGWWSYFGAWNFKNQSSENYNYYIPDQQVTVKPGSSGKISLLDDQGMNINAVITRGSGNNSTTAYTEALYSDSGKQIMVNDTPYNPLNISHLIVIEDGYVVKNESVGNVKDANYTLMLIGDKNQYTPILMNNELRDSMFTRLFLLGGAGQDIFENVHADSGVMLFKVNFNKTAAES